MFFDLTTLFRPGTTL